MGEASQTERVRQHQLAVAKSMGVPPAVLEVLGKAEDWKLREWLYICALDGFPAERLGEYAKGGTDVATLCRIREQFWRERCARTDDLRKDVESLGREVRQASLESKAAREAVEAGVGEAMKRKEREHAEALRAKESAILVLKSRVGELEGELGRLKGEKTPPGVTATRTKPGTAETAMAMKERGQGAREKPGVTVKEGEQEVRKEPAGQGKTESQTEQADRPAKKAREEPDGQGMAATWFPRAVAARFQARRREREAKRFIDRFVAGGDLTAEQLDYLLECLEEGVNVREMERIAAPGVPVSVMRRLMGLRRKGG